MPKISYFAGEVKITGSAAMMLPVMMSLAQSSLSDTKLKWRGYICQQPDGRLQQYGPWQALDGSFNQNYDNLQMTLTCRLISESHDAISSELG